MIRGTVLTILAALLGVTAACSLGVAAYIIIQPETSPENGVAETEAQLAGVEVVDNNGEHVDNDALPDISVDSGAVWTDSEVSNPERTFQPPDEHPYNLYRTLSGRHLSQCLRLLKM